MITVPKANGSGWEGRKGMRLWRNPKASSEEHAVEAAEGCGCFVAFLLLGLYPLYRIAQALFFSL